MRQILMCDDDVFILRAAELKLRGAGFEVTFANDGQQAWELLQEAEFAAMVTDRQMPRVDGLELIRRVRSADKPGLARLPVVLLTSRAHDLPSDLDVDCVMDKPFSPRNLLKQIQALVAGDQAAPDQAAPDMAAPDMAAGGRVAGNTVVG